MAGIQGVVKAVVCREGMTPVVILKPFRGTSHDGVPIAHVVPVPPSRVGDLVTIIGGRLKGEMGSVVELHEGRVLLRLESSGSIVEVRKDWMCRFSRESDTTQADGFETHISPPNIPPPPGLEEDGEIIQPSTSPPPPSSSGVRPFYAISNTPTQPRSFLGNPSSSSKPSPRPPPVLAPPSRPRQTSPIHPAATRPPSGPKALRAGGPKGTYTPPHPSYPPKRSFGTNPNGGVPQAPLPRGPSADRERDREWTGSAWASRSRPPPSSGWR
jgi:hypothetical protein